MKLIRIIIFLSIALPWSFVWFSQKHLILPYTNSIPPLVLIFLGLIPTIGLLIGGFLMRIKSPSNLMSFKGKKPVLSLVIFCIPIFCLFIIGVDNNINIQPNIFGLLIGVFTLFYATLEEYGWRGYLQQEFIGSSQKWFGYILVGLIWYLWHWYFLRGTGNPRLIMIPILIASSIGIGEVAKMTKSILICGALHGIVNILFIYSLISERLTIFEKVIILIICISVWVPIIIRINKKKQINATSND